jgi:glucuronokinase
MIEGIAYARAGILGNPSDGYFGKIIAISVKNFAARCILEESAKLRIEPQAEDRETYGSLQELAESVGLYGYYGGVRLIKAALKKFYEYCRSRDIPLHSQNFTIGYESTIPRQVGLGGSSAIVTATMRALMKFYGVEIPIHLQPSLVLSSERDELDISAGFMDRVTQVYEGCVYMDLPEAMIREKGYGIYERLDPQLLPDLYLAYKPSLGKVSGRVLNDIRIRYERGDAFVIETLRQIAGLAEMGKAAMLAGDREALFDLMNKNFDLRRKIMNIHPGNIEMIETARRLGASAKFAGSGGSILGIYKGQEMYDKLVSELTNLGARVIRPIVE